jgi:hypothetical protein
MPCIIYLPAGVNASLDFEAERQTAFDAIEKGLKLEFQIDLGLFSRLKKPLSHKSQYLSLDLSLEHFKNTLWEEFQYNIDDVCLYSGHVDFSKDFIFDEIQESNLQGWMEERFSEVDNFVQETSISVLAFSEITPELLSKYDLGRSLISYFCRDACLEYIHILKANLPDEMPLSLHLDASGITDPLFFALLTSRELYHSFELKVTNGMQNLSNQTKPPVAICLPSSKRLLPSVISDLRKAFDLFKQQNIAYRVIPESLLITEWDLVDFLFVIPTTLDKEGKRKLQGFAAAGGTVVCLGDEIGIPGEASFQTYVNNILSLSTKYIKDTSSYQTG